MAGLLPLKGGRSVSWFKFNDKLCDDMKVRYAPGAVERGGTYAKLTVQESENTSRDGGMHFGVRRKPIVFALPCFYEEITRKEKENILRWLKPGARGKLVFDDREYCTYDAVVTGDIQIEEYPASTADGMRYSGIFTVGLTAYDPWAVLNERSAEAGDAYDRTGLIPEWRMPAEPNTESTDFMVYNPGDAECGLIIRIAGNIPDGGKVDFHNEATGQTCTVVGLTNELTTDAGMWVEIDSEKMTVTHVGAAQKKTDYGYHDDGYIVLAPGEAEKESLHVLYDTYGSVFCEEGFADDIVGKYIHVAGDWREVIHRTDDHTVETRWISVEDGEDDAIVAVLNRIVITKSEGVELSKLEIDYQPKVR